MSQKTGDIGRKF